MLIFFGTKQPRTELGRVADVCRDCLEVTPHTIEAVQQVAHVYWVSIGPRRLQGYSVTCSRCGRKTENPRVERYTWIEEDPEVPLDELMRVTHPGAVLELEARQTRDARARSGRLTPEERVQVMQEALEPFEERAAKRAEQTHFDRRSGLMSAATVVLGIACATYPPAALGVLVLGTAATLHALATDVRRFVERELAAEIVVTLKRHHPSPHEIDTLMDALGASKSVLSRKLGRTWLADQVFCPGAGFEDGTRP